MSAIIEFLAVNTVQFSVPLLQTLWELRASSAREENTNTRFRVLVCCGEKVHQRRRRVPTRPPSPISASAEGAGTVRVIERLSIPIV